MQRCKVSDSHYGVFTAEHERVTLLAFLDKGG